MKTVCVSLVLLIAAAVCADYTLGFSGNAKWGAHIADDLSAPEGVKIFDKKGYFLDLDGTTYNGEVLIDGVKETIEWFRQNDKRFMFLTNSASRTQEGVVKKLAKLGLEGIEPSQVYSSALATAHFMAHNSVNKTAFVVGAVGIKDALAAYDFVQTDVTPEFVVIGNTKPDGGWGYDVFLKAGQLVANGAHLIMTSPDENAHTPEGPKPGVGALASVVEVTTGKKAFSVGKPSAYIMQQALKAMGLPLDEVVMVGDNLNTDVLSGVNFGMDTCFVLSGIHDKGDLADKSFRPTYILPSVAHIPKGE